MVVYAVIGFCFMEVSTASVIASHRRSNLPVCHCERSETIYKIILFAWDYFVAALLAMTVCGDLSPCPPSLGDW